MRKKKDPSLLGDFVGDYFNDSCPIGVTGLYKIWDSLKYSIRYSRPICYLRYLVNRVYYSPLLDRNSEFKELETIRDRNINNREQFLEESMVWAFCTTHLGFPAATDIINLRTTYPKLSTEKLYTQMRFLILRKL